MGIVSRQITPDVIRSAASQLSEDRGSTASALSAAVPSALTALSDVASSDTGARHLKEVIDEKRRATAQGIDADRSLFPSTRTEASEHAASLIENELGPRSTTIAQAVASATGIKTASAQRLMGGVASVAVAALAQSSGSMGAGALQSMFREQRSGWVRKLPGPVASLFNGHSLQPGAAGFERGYDERILTGPAIRELEAPRRNWMIPLILVALALLAIPVLRGLRRPSAPQVPERANVPQPTEPSTAQPQPQAPAPAVTPPAPVETAPAPEATPTEPEATPPTAAVPAVEPGTTEDMAAFLDGAGETTPHAFAPTPLNFAFASAKPTPESRATIDEVASILVEHPSATIRVESHTDAIGSPESNLDLSQARAEAVKDGLVDRGVDASRIETAGMGQDLPIASNDTAEGRAKNRRTEIVVTGR
jgi:outer membrane protein OmpA-like peptidoglycan-associated protein